jgi:hypothetical protein
LGYIKVGYIRRKIEPEISKHETVMLYATDGNFDHLKAK